MGLIILGVVVGLFLLAIVKMIEVSSKATKIVNTINLSTNTKLLILFIPIAFFTALASYTVVGTGEIAVMTRFGRVTGQELSEGLHFKVPIDKANKYDVKVQRETADAAAASKDLQDVNTVLVINYKLKAGKVSEIHRTIGIDYKEKLIDPALQEVFKASTAKFDATELITDRAQVKEDTLKLLQRRLDDFGITIINVSITNFSFSQEFSKSIEDKQVAQQNAERAKFNLERAIIDAEAQRVQKTSLSAELLRKYELDNQSDAIKKWNGAMPTYVGGGSVFNIPLEK